MRPFEGSLSVVAEKMRTQDEDGTLSSTTEKQEFHLLELLKLFQDQTKQRESDSYDDSSYVHLQKSVPNVASELRTSSLIAETAQKRWYPGGIRYITRTVSDKGEVISEKDADHSTESSDSDSCSEYWLKVINAQSRKQDSLPEKRAVVICDIELRDLVRTVIRPYIDHTNKAAWQQKEVVLKGNAFAILLNYAELEQATRDTPGNSASSETRKRLLRLLQIVQNQSENDLLQAIDVSTPVQDFRISWKYVWTMFKAGTLIVSAWNQAEDLQVFKVHDFSIAKNECIVVKAWIWDWDGKDLVRTLYEFHIGKYDGERAPAELICYPMKFCQTPPVDTDQRKNLFCRFTFEQSPFARLLHYRGDIISGCREVNNDTALFRYALRRSDSVFEATLSNSRRLRIHRVDEDIIIDTENYIRRCGGGRWLGNLEPSPGKLCSCTLCINDHTKEWMKALKSKEDFSSWENELLLAPRLTGFTLGRKEWCQFSLNCISVIENRWAAANGPESDSECTSFRRLAGRSLVLPDDLEDQEQDDIFNMVATHPHVMTKSPDKRVGDVIGGKGESLILLFHGHSGTGKTLYAECLAKASLRPLFKVGTSEIGLEAAAAERNLKEIFELAESWNAILLMYVFSSKPKPYGYADQESDEADVLLDARGGANESLLSKNALVSVLLREVEYFKGILIMTTNRVKAFDPAVLTRIHHAVNFEATTQKQEALIWNNWVNLLQDRNLTKNIRDIQSWLRSMLARKGRTTLSGREIRNVFIQAQSIAAAANDKEVNITSQHLDRAYEYRQSFRRDTNEQRIESHGLHVQRKSNM